MSKKRYRKQRYRDAAKAKAFNEAHRQPDLEMELAEAIATPQDAEKLLQEARDAGVEVFTKTYKPDTDTVMYGKPQYPADVVREINSTAVPDYEKRAAGAWKYPDEVDAATQTHSRGIRPHPHDHDVARTLLKIAEQTPPLHGETKDDRPLIDLLHEATFTNPLGVSPIKDLYALRMTLRKAHCFTLNEATSAMVADFSMATVQDLDASRQMAIPPFPVTWIELDNFARLKRMFALSAPLEKYDPDNPPVKKIGWLIHPSPEASGYYATYVAGFENDIWVAPMSYWWHIHDPNPDKPDRRKTVEVMEWLAFGTAGNVGAYDAFPHPSNLHHHYSATPPKALIDAMTEMAGELRHIWGFLIALGAGHLGASAQYTPQAAPTTAPPIMKNGKPLLPLEHKVLHLHLNKKPPAKIIAQSITHHHNRRHDVRAHWRLLKSGKRVPVRSHQRGDELLGRIEKTYRVER